MATYLVDAVAMLRYLVDELPAAASEVFERAEDGVDTLYAPDIQLAEVLYQVGHGAEVAGVPLQGDPRETLRLLVRNGPVEVASIGERELGVYASEVGRYTMHDGLFVATHRVLGTDGIVSKDREFTDEPVIWD